MSELKLKRMRGSPDGIDEGAESRLVDSVLFMTRSNKLIFCFIHNKTKYLLNLRTTWSKDLIKAPTKASNYGCMGSNMKMVPMEDEAQKDD